jgi:hypothetical protein
VCVKVERDSGVGMGIRCFDAMFEAGEVGCVKIARWFGSSCSGDWNDRWFRNALVVWFVEWGENGN